MMYRTASSIDIHTRGLEELTGSQNGMTGMLNEETHHSLLHPRPPPKI